MEGRLLNWKGFTKDNYAFELGMLIGKMIHSASKAKTESKPNIEDIPMDIKSTNENNKDKDEDSEVKVVEQYNIEAIDQFTAQDNSQLKKKLSKDTEKTWMLDYIEGLAQKMDPVCATF